MDLEKAEEELKKAQKAFSILKEEDNQRVLEKNRLDKKSKAFKDSLDGAMSENEAKEIFLDLMEIYSVEYNKYLLAEYLRIDKSNIFRFDLFKEDNKLIVALITKIGGKLLNSLMLVHGEARKNMIGKTTHLRTLIRKFNNPEIKPDLLKYMEKTIIKEEEIMNEDIDEISWIKPRTRSGSKGTPFIRITITTHKKDNYRLVVSFSRESVSKYGLKKSNFIDYGSNDKNLFINLDGSNSILSQSGHNMTSSISVNLLENLILKEKRTLAVEEEDITEIGKVLKIDISKLEE